VLDRITHADDLGVYMDPKLNFSDHITSMVNKDRGVLTRKVTRYKVEGIRWSLCHKDLVYFISQTNS